VPITARATGPNRPQHLARNGYEELAARVYRYLANRPRYFRKPLVPIKRDSASIA
jgi:hypothetical protein